LALSGTEVILSEEQSRWPSRTITSPKKRVSAGLHRGAMQVSEDFDAPLPDRSGLVTHEWERKS